MAGKEFCIIIEYSPYEAGGAIKLAAAEIHSGDKLGLAEIGNAAKFSVNKGYRPFEMTLGEIRFSIEAGPS